VVKRKKATRAKKQWWPR
jgi:hypothetical protein